MNVKYFTGQLTKFCVYGGSAQEPNILPRTVLRPRHLGTVVKNQYPHFHFRFVFSWHAVSFTNTEAHWCQYHVVTRIAWLIREVYSLTLKYIRNKLSELGDILSDSMHYLFIILSLMVLLSAFQKNKTSIRM